MPRPPIRTALAVASTLLTATALSGCSSDDSDPDNPPDGSPGSAGTDDPGVTTTEASIRKVTGGTLPAKEKEQLQKKITEVVDNWFEAAYLGGEYPRTDFEDAYAVFTPRAQERAREDTKLMSNEGVGTTTYAARADARKVEIDVLADKKKGAAAVTAAFTLDMTRVGETGGERSEEIRGQLYLTFTKGDGWRVFAYDVQRGDV